MSDTIKFRCDLNTTDSSAPLGFEVLLNDTTVFKTLHVTESCQVMFDITDSEAVQKLQFVMSGKTAEHTRVDDNGTITQDAMLEISNITIDDVDIGLIVTDKSEYVHDFNGTSESVKDKFYSNMGCNGTVTVEFTTPFYLWLLENM
jgi:hypothetical protein